MGSVNFVCALPTEAAPLRARLGLKSMGDTPFRIFAGDGARLIVSGIGSAASAAAVGYLAGRGSAPHDTMWINFGIAGHRDLATGSAVLADRVSSAAGGRTWYPSLLFRPPCATGPVTSFEHPVNDYPPSTCCDMEAAGFMAAATRVAQADLVHVLKVVSDNRHSGIERIDRNFVRELVGANLDTVAALADALRVVAGNLPRPLDPEPVARLLSHRHFTSSQATQLEALWRRHCALGGDAGAFAAGTAACRDAAEVLAVIERALAHLPLSDGTPPA